MAMKIKYKLCEVKKKIKTRKKIYKVSNPKKVGTGVSSKYILEMRK